MNEDSSINPLVLSQHEMAGIYMTLSEPCADNIDVIGYFTFINASIEECFDKEFLQIESDSLLQNPNLIATKLIELFKYIFNGSRDKEFRIGKRAIGYVFIGFCDYFSINNHQTFLGLPNKLQLMIKKSASSICGNEIYKQVERKALGHQNIKVTSIFDL